MIILRKPDKKDYFEPKSYRLIALLSIIGKALKAIVARRLSDYAEKHDLLPQKQIGVRRGRSTKTAFETLINAVNTVWECGKWDVTSLLSLDVARTFENVSHNQLLYNLRIKRVPS